MITPSEYSNLSPSHRKHTHRKIYVFLFLGEINNKVIKLRRSCTKNGKKGRDRKLDENETFEKFIEKRKVKFTWLNSPGRQLCPKIWLIFKLIFKDIYIICSHFHLCPFASLSTASSVYLSEWRCFVAPFTANDFWGPRLLIWEHNFLLSKYGFYFNMAWYYIYFMLLWSYLTWCPQFAAIKWVLLQKIKLYDCATMCESYILIHRIKS